MFLSFSHIAPAHCEAFFSSPKSLLKKHFPFPLCLSVSEGYLFILFFFFALPVPRGFAVGIRGAILEALVPLKLQFFKC